MSKAKQVLRMKMQNELKEMDELIRKEASRKIALRLYEEDIWEQARTVGITVSVNEEVDTYTIIQEAWRRGKRVVIPKCERAHKSMTFREIVDFKQLEIVYMNLKEPIPSVTKAVHPQEIDLLIVPGVAFDVRGNRLGYGGGYYDRFLTSYKGNITALAYSVQVVEAVPVTSHDRPIPKIITEKETIFIG